MSLAPLRRAAAETRLALAAALLIGCFGCRPASPSPDGAIRLRQEGPFLLVAEIHLPEVEAELTLPADLIAGELISGTLALSEHSPHLPAPGESDVPSAGFHLVLGDRRVPFEASTVQARLREGSGTLRIRILDASDRLRAETSIGLRRPSDLAAGETESLPKYCSRTGLVLPGSFDGNSSNTRVELGGVPLSLRAESPRHATTMPFEHAPGPATLVVEEGARRREAILQVLGLQVEPERLRARAGERVPYLILVDGLAELDHGLRPFVAWTCRSRDGAPSLLRRDEVIQPASAEDGLVILRREFAAEATGEFLLEARLQPAPTGG